MCRISLAVMPTIVLMGAVSFALPTFAQNSDFNLNVHANSHVTAKDIGLPSYPEVKRRSRTRTAIHRRRTWDFC